MEGNMVFFKLLGSRKNLEKIDLKILISRHLHGKNFFEFFTTICFWISPKDALGVSQSQGQKK